MIALLSCLLLAFSTNVPLLAATDAIQEPVLDIQGEKLRPGTLYNILSPFWGAASGGLTLADGIGNDTCPPNVVLGRPLRYGLPAWFTPVNNEEVIRTSTDLNIAFFVVCPQPRCYESPVWRVHPPYPKFEHFYVTTGGIVGQPGPGTWSSWFKIEKVGERVYKLVFCPSVCKFCTPLCLDLGIENGRLVLSDIPFGFRFQKTLDLRTIAS